MTNVLEPTRFTSVKLANRFVLAPMTRTSARVDGVPSDIMVRQYERYARGGFGLLISEGTYTDNHASQGYANQPGLINFEQANGWRAVLERVHAAGSRMFVQLMHAGAQFQANRFTDQPLAPSGVAPRGEPLGLYGDQKQWLTPRAMTGVDIDHAIEGFRQSARLAREAGFDGIELHGANGYLLNQFLSSYFNRRDDEYGGSLAHRLRLVEAVIRGVREEVGPDYPVGIRLSQGTVTDPDYQLPEGQAGFEQILVAVRDAGADFVHTTDGQVNRRALIGGNDSLAQVAARVPGIELIINGGITEESYQELANQYPGALLAVGKKALANPDFVQRLKDGKALDELDFAMLQPKATLANEHAWREAQAAT